MKKTLLIVAMLLLVATPVMATTTVKVLVNPAEQYFTVPGEPNKVQPVTIAYVTDVNVRAFALDINIDSSSNAPNFQRIWAFKTGECTATSKGYGIFPSRFRDFVNAANPDPCYALSTYNPTAAYNEPDTIDPRTGLGWSKMTVEMGTLYAGDANKPAMSGTLFKFDVNSWGTVGTFHITVAPNALRGGVVDNAGNSILPPTLVLEGNDVTFGAACTTIPAILNSTMTDANTAITGVGLTVAAPITYECNATYAVGRVARQQTGCVTPGSSVWYVVSLGTTPGVPASITVPATDADGKYSVTWTAGSPAGTSYQLEDSCDTTSWKQVYSGTALTYAVKVGGGTWRYRVKATNACGSSAYRTGGNTCVVTDCLKSTAPAAELAAWKLWRYPAGWCYNRQCRGDINGAISLGKPITSADMTIFSGAFNKTDAELALVVNGIGADLNHAASLGKRVTSADMTIFSTYFNLATASVPCCDTAAPAGDCTLVAGDKYSYWTTP